MKLRKWLFVLPYYVVVSTGTNDQGRVYEIAKLRTHEYEVIEAKPEWGPDSQWVILQYQCPPEYKCAEYVKDLANALNDSRERREQLKYGSLTNTLYDPIPRKQKIQNK